MFLYKKLTDCLHYLHAIFLIEVVNFVIKNSDALTVVVMNIET